MLHSTRAKNFLARIERQKRERKELARDRAAFARGFPVKHAQNPILSVMEQESRVVMSGAPLSEDRGQRQEATGQQASPVYNLRSAAVLLRLSIPELRRMLREKRLRATRAAWGTWFFTQGQLEQAKRDLASLKRKEERGQGTTDTAA